MLIAFLHGNVAGSENHQLILRQHSLQCSRSAHGSDAVLAAPENQCRNLNVEDDTPKSASISCMATFCSKLGKVLLAGPSRISEIVFVLSRTLSFRRLTFASANCRARLSSPHPARVSTMRRTRLLCAECPRRLPGSATPGRGDTSRQTTAIRHPPWNDPPGECLLRRSDPRHS